MERQLTGALPLPMWPDGIAISKLEPVAVHALMRVCYAQGYGEVPERAEDWWDMVSDDSEFDSDLAIVVSEPSGVPAGFVLCWTSSFIKDLVVRPDLRWRGIGASLLSEAFRRLAARGHQSVALKVKEENAVARKLYERMGFKASFAF